MVGQERAVDLVAVLVDQVPGRVGDLDAVGVGLVVRARAELRRDVPVAVQRLEAAVPARLVRQHVGRRGRRWAGLVAPVPLGGGAEGIALGAVHGDAVVVRDLSVLEGVRVRVELRDLGRVGAEYLGEVDAVVLQLLVGRGHVAYIAPGPGERHPRRRGDRARRHRVRGGSRRHRGVDHVRVGVPAGRHAVRVEDRVGPVGERGGDGGGVEGAVRAVGVVGPVAVGDRHALPVAVQPGIGGQDVVGGVRDERRVAVAQEGAVVLEEVQQVRHHLQVGRDVGVVPEEVHIVERELHHVLDPVAEVAGRRAVGGDGGRLDRGCRCGGLERAARGGACGAR